MDQANLDVLSAQIVVLADAVTILADRAEAREQENDRLIFLGDTLALAGDFLALLAIQAEQTDEEPGESAQLANRSSSPKAGKTRTARLNGLRKRR